MKEIVYNKLVRDKIPQIIEADGKTCEIEVLPEDEYLKMIDAKLDEEIAEYHKDQNLEELADLLEVIYAAAIARGHSIEELEALRAKKAEKRGGFQERILLKKVVEEELAASSKFVDARTLTCEELYKNHMKKAPDVLQLKLSLDMCDPDQDEREILYQYGKVNKGITREILVPADITLHALSYVIMRCFGWQNSHLHQFKLPPEVFQKLTGGKNKVSKEGYVEKDGLYTDWMKLCGIYFRFPCDDFKDLYWDDDYEEGKCFKTWLRKKYTGPYRYEGRWEHYYYANETAKSVITQNPVIRKPLSFAEWQKMQAEGKEPKDEFIPVEKATIQQMSFGFESGMDELLERLPLIQVLLPEFVKEDENLRERISFLQKRQEKTDEELPVIPVAKNLTYAYDYGDGWEVDIKMTGCYYIKDSEDGAEASGSEVGSKPTNVRQSLATAEAYDMNNFRCPKGLNLKVAMTHYKRCPVCLELDGMSVMDDVGGIHGYVDFLRTIHGDDQEQKEELRDWAKWMGWTGRMSSADKLI